MENTETFLQYGEMHSFEPGKTIYNYGDKIQKESIYYISAGLVKILFKLKNNSTFTRYLPSNTIFGIFDSLTSDVRLSSATPVEKTFLYVWEKDKFELATQISWELAEISLRSLTHNLRVLNAQYAEKEGIFK